MRKKLKIGILDLASRAPTRKMWSRMMRANLASIMPQIVGVWSEEAGHEVHFVCYTGSENLLEELPSDIDVLFISAFTRSAHLAYAISNMYQKQGTVTVLGGPHARCYPEDCQKYFDYVLGITDKTLVDDLLHDCTQQ
ncbi:MAG: cobalamin B12-binding domain-containing protein, partial [Rhodospirillales bacterium]|nr:cobalamin B12-binding domain-containing protein [Rhodospirillales bacterium]